MMPVRLYDSAISGNCYKVRLLLSHLGRPYERVDVAFMQTDDREGILGGKNPTGKIPTLELDDGRALGESNAILWYLAQGTHLLPSDPFEQAKVLQWLFFEQNNLEANIAMARFWVHVLKAEREYREHLELKYDGGYAALRALESGLAEHEFLVADRYSIADISLYAYTHVAPEGGFSLADYPAIRAWLARVQEQPGYVPMIAAVAPGAT